MQESGDYRDKKRTKEKQGARSPLPAPSRTSSVQSERPELEKTASGQSAESTRLGLKSTASADIAQSTDGPRAEVKSTASVGSESIRPDEDSQIFLFVNELQNEPPELAEPWKRLYDTRVATQDDIKEIRDLLHAQGTNLGLPVSWTWTEAEKAIKSELYDKGYQPTVAGDFVERLARFPIAMTGALFILVPTYIMALQQSQTKNLVTTTVAVVLFAITCSIMLKTSNEQTLAATTGYAAVLMVFVGLTTT